MLGLEHDDMLRKTAPSGWLFPLAGTNRNADLSETMEWGEIVHECQPTQNQSPWNFVIRLFG